MNTIELLKQSLPMSQKDAAKLFNVTQPAVHKWLTGKSRPSAKSTIAIEAITGISRYRLRPDVFGPAPAATHEDRIA